MKYFCLGDIHKHSWMLSSINDLARGYSLTAEMAHHCRQPQEREHPLRCRFRAAGSVSTPCPRGSNPYSGKPT